MTNKQRIQNALYDLAVAGVFYAVEYVPGTSKQVDIDPTTALVVPPDSTRSNEISGSFTDDQEYGRSRILKQVGWTWALYLEWQNKEVTLEYFLESLTKKLPFLPKTDVFRSVTLKLLKYDVDHPVHQDCSTGTSAKIMFNVELGRA